MASPNPIYKVELALSAGPYDDPAAATWTDISADVLSINGNCGRAPDAGRTSTGHFEIDVLDPTGKYDPANTSSPYYPNVTQDRLVRVRFSDYADRLLADSPAGWWRLDETAGSTAVDQVAARNATLVNTPTLGAAGALVLEGDTAMGFAAASSRRGDVTYAAALNPAAVTVEAWIYRTGTGIRSIVTSLTSNRGYRLRLNASNVIEWSVGNGTTTSTVTGATTIATSTWTHVVATSTASAQTVYVNGALDATGALAYSTATSGTLQIGADNSTNYWDGRLDEIAVYQAALPAIAARHHYEMGAGLTHLATGAIEDYQQNYGKGPGQTTVTIKANDLGEALERVAAPLDHESIVRRLAPTRWFRFAEIAAGKCLDEGSSPTRSVASAQAVVVGDQALGHDLQINGGVTYPVRTPALNVGTADWTLSLWARSDLTGYTEQMTLLGRPDWPLGSGEYMHLRHWQHDVVAGTDTHNVTGRCGRFPSAQNWTHYLVTRQTAGGNETVTIWVNGDQIATQSWAGAATNITGTTPVTAQPFSAGGTIHIAQMAVWVGTVLTPAQIAMLWQSGPAGWQAQRPEERIATALALAGVAAASQLDRGSSLLAATAGGSALSICQDAAVADEGMFCVDGRGRPTFHSRQSRRRLGSAPVYTFGDAVASTSEVPYKTVTLNNDNAKLWTAAVVNGQRSVDPTAAAPSAHGERAPSADESRSVLTARDAKARAQGLVAAHKDPATRIEQIEWQLPQTRGSALVLQLALNDWIRVIRRPRAGQTITRDLHVEQIRWDVNVGGGGGSAGSGTVTAQLAAADPAQNSAVQFDVSTYAGTDKFTW